MTWNDLPSPEKVFTVGTNLNGFKITHPFGKAGMSWLFHAERGDEKGLVKIFYPEKVNHETIARFHHEAIVLGGLKIAGVPKLYSGVSEHNGLHYFIMNFVDGESIEKMMRPISDEALPIELTHYPLPEQSVFRIAYYVSHVLKMLHQKQIIHRDIKPGNILYSKDAVHLCDFGIARSPALEESIDRMLEIRGNTLGTREFMSPEQMKAGVPINPSTDIYSLGATLFFALTGSQYFIRYGVDTGIDAPYPRKYWPKLQAGWDKIIAECMDHDPKKRPTAEKLFNMIEGLNFRL